MSRPTARLIGRLPHRLAPKTDYLGRFENSFIYGWNPNTPYTQWTHGRFFKQKSYDRGGAQQALVADSPGQTFADLYRHGKYPPNLPGNRLSNRGGKISYNILYCDGHAVTTNDWREAFRFVRMRFPG